ncbi:voltage-gated potassium channel [Flavobacteriaceae bacterium MAR_2010_188]|nr:voltage-gated potassium channel [Flavobacteriaceae bacterium MAR_2010_188]
MAFLNIFKSKIYTSFALMLIVLLMGVLGFRIISGFSWLDAMYMTVITITTVGFGEVQPLDDVAKIFTMVLILTSIVILGYALSTITNTF